MVFTANQKYDQPFIQNMFLDDPPATTVRRCRGTADLETPNDRKTQFSSFKLSNVKNDDCPINSGDGPGVCRMVCNVSRSRAVLTSECLIAGAADSVGRGCRK